MRQSTPHEREPAYFEAVAERYAALYAEDSAVGTGFRLRRRRVLELFDKPGGVVLDVGCGPGVMTEQLLARGCNYHGVDASAGMIARCKQRFGAEPRAHFSVGIAEQTGFPDGAFDAVLCVGVVDRHANDGALFCELVRVLKPGGTLLVTASNVGSPYLWWRDFAYYPIVRVVRSILDRFTPHTRPTAGEHRLHSARTLSRKLADLGCPATDVAYTGFLLVPSPLDVLLPGLASASMQRLESWNRGPLRHLAFFVVVKASKPERR